jgi:DNA-binding MarR family transcriptional regulator
MTLQDNPMLGSTASVQLFRTITTLAAHLRVRMDQRLATIDLTTQQAAVLSVVDAAAEPPTLGGVAELLGSSHQNARQIVAALERKGLLEVTVDSSDRRARRLRVTPAADGLFATRDPSDHREVELWFGALSEEEQRQAVALLRRVLADLVS